MVDYIVTVAVQSAAGTNAVTSAIPGLMDYSLEITVGVVLILFFVNLRGLREAGRTFAFPTYFFAACMAVVIIGGLAREVVGDLPQYDPVHAPGAFPMGGGSALLSFGAIYILLKSFANGGSSLTGLEAISNGVSAFRSPRGRNARKTLVVMSCILGTLVAGESDLAGVDDDDEVTGVDVVRERGLVLATQQRRRLHGQTTEDDVFGVDDVPLPGDVAGLGGVSAHVETFAWFECQGW